MRALTPLTFGAVRPQGWLAERMRRDLDAVVGHLDALVPDLIVDDDIYGSDRLTAAVTAKDLGAVTDVDLEHPEQFLWWNSETQSNWRDGWIRHVLLVGTEAERAAARAYVEAMVATADPDGYLGIHAPDLRFPTAGENGELWAQATLGRALLAYVEAGADRAHTDEVLSALVRALRVTMTAWPIGTSQPFGPDGFAGAAHGLVLTDVLDRVADLTGDEGFRTYAAWLYRAYSAAEVSEPDARLGRLLDPEQGLCGHGVHSYEHLRPVVVAAEVDPDPRLAQAREVYLARIRHSLTPAHGPIGDEWIQARAGDATSTGYELCSTQELLDSLLRLMASTGDLSLADDAEAVLLNAGLGAWHPTASAVAYLQTDNALTMAGNRAGAPEDPHQTRYRYSPVHREAAVCCVPNAGRLLPTYLRAAVLRRGCDVVVALYGPMTAGLDVDGVPVRLTIATDFPESFEVTVRVSSAAPVDFALVLRRPAWATGVRVSAAEAVVGQREVVLTRRWTDDEVVLGFDAAPHIRIDRVGEGYVSLGPRVLALAIPDRTRVTRQHDVPGFADLAVEPISDEHARLRLVLDRPDLLREVDGGVEAPFLPLGAEAREPAAHRLEPLGRAALRRVTFPVVVTR